MSRPRTERPSVPTIFSHLGAMVLVSVVLGVVVAGLAIPFAGLTGFAVRSTSDSLDDLPQELETGVLSERTTILDSQGKQIASLYDQNRITVSLNQVSKMMIKAILSIEDYRFYEHGALDLRGTLRAFVTNAGAGDVVQGGSSLTQQLVKQTLLYQATTPEERKAATDDSYARKFRELRYAIALEKKHSKDWILERYLNTVYFGDGAYGIQSAAKHYFNVNARRLNLRQAAMLAGLVQNPSAFDPTEHPEQALERRNVVLDRMAELSVIPEQRAEHAKGTKLGLKVQQINNGCVNSPTPFFCQYVIAWLLKDPQLPGKNAQERMEFIQRGGLTIRTTVDQRFQRAADKSVTTHVYPNDNAIGALAMVQPGTGHVKALAQSRPMGANKAAGQTYLNYTVPRQYGKANGFQAGSTFKAFVLASAIMQEIPLSKNIKSPPTILMDESTYKTCDGNYQSNGTWPVSNSGSSGTFNLYTGTRNSVNTFYAQLEQLTGICKPYNLAKQMGVRLNDRTHEMVPSFTLGIADVSPLEMAEAYATFAARGKHCDALPVTSITDTDGNMLKEYKPECTQVMASPVADAVNDVLRGVQEGGFGSAIQLYDRDDAGKTGTTSKNLAVWFCGYTPELATASMVAGANKDGTWTTLNGQTIGGVYRYSAFGATTAGPLWGDAMREIAQYLEPTQFTKPSSTDIAGVVTSVPSVAGYSEASARTILEDAGFTVEVGGRTRSTYDKDLVAYSVPGAGAQLGSGDTVVIYLSNGRPPKKKKGKPNRDNDDD